MKWQMDHKYRTVLFLHSLDSLCQILKEFRRESLDNFTPVKLQENNADIANRCQNHQNDLKSEAEQQENP